MITFEDWKNRAQYFKYKSHDIACWEEGSGPDLLLIHGFPTASWDWYKVWDKLVTKFRVLAIDMIGFGYSDKPHNYTYSITDQARLQEAFLAEKNIKDVHLFVHDYGNSVGQEMLAAFHERESEGVQILSCAFMNGGLFPELHHARPIQTLLKGPLGFIFNKLLNKNSLKRNFDKIYGNKKPSDQEIDQFYELMKYNDGLKNVYKLMRYINDRKANAERWKKALTNASIPLAMINGPLDPISGIHLAEYFRELLPHAQTTILEGVGHYPHDEAPDETLEAYLSFAESLTLSS